MKILYVNGLHTGGTKIVVENTIRAISKKHEVFFFGGVETDSTPRYSVCEEENRGVLSRCINVRRMRNTRIKRNYYNPRFNPIYLEFVDKIRPDLIHFHSVQPMGANLIKETIKLSIPFCLSMHDWWWFCPRNSLADIFLRVCQQNVKIDPERCYCVNKKRFETRRYGYLRGILDQVRTIIVPSEYMKTCMVSQDIDPKRVFVNENGIWPARSFKRKPVSDQLRFGYLGGGTGYKGFHILLQAIKKIRAGHCVINLYNFEAMSEIREKHNLRSKLHAIRRILEKLIDEPYEKLHQLSRQLKNRKLLKSTDQVQINFFPPFTNDDLDEVFSHIDVLLLPSIVRESFSLVVREALIRKIPAIISDCGGPEEVIRDGVNGFIVPTSDAAALAGKMNEMIENPQIVEACSRRIDTNSIVTVEEQVRNLEAIYSRMKESGPASSR